MGFGGGHWGGGPSSANSNTAAGLPFAGIPPEMMDQAEKLLKKEPDHSTDEVKFSHYAEPEPPFTLTSFLLPHRVAMSIGLFLVLLETLFTLMGPLLIQLGIDRGILKDSFSTLITFTIIFVVSIIFGALMSQFRIVYTGKVSENLMYQLRVKLFTHLQRLSMSYYTREKTGVVMSRMTSDVEYLTILFQEGLVNFAVQGLTLITIVAILFYLHPLLAAVAVFVAIPLTFGLSLWFRKVSDESYGKIRNRIADILSHLSESLAGIRIIKAHNRQLNESIVHDNHIGRYKDANLEASFANAKYTSVTEGIGILVQAVVLGVGGYFVVEGRMTIGELTAFALYLTSFFAPIQTLVQLYNSYQQGQSAARKLRELLSEEPSVPEIKDAKPLGELKGNISFKGVDFSYNPGTQVLSDINFDLAEGETLAIVGPTGGGKSTIAKLISRFYDPTTGQISVDGQNLSQISIKSYRSQIAIVPQEPFLFYGSIADNLSVADPKAKTKDLQAAIDAVGLTNLVNQLPQKLDTPCHERGASFSAGERQLLALARVFIAKPRLLILDEATSNLDLQSESKIESALDILLEGRTAILIAHRLSTALRANRIAVVEDGKIQELGSHQELLAKGKIYKSLYNTWQEHGGQAT